MKFPSAATALLTLPFTYVAANPVNLAPLLLHDDSTGGYVVKLKDSASAVADNNILQLLSIQPDHVFSQLINAFSAKLDGASLSAIRQHPDVRHYTPHPNTPGFISC